MLTQWYDPEPGPAALPGVYAREFVSQGHKVSVLTGYPNYPEGRLYPGYSVRTVDKEGVSPLSVTRVPLYPDHSRSVLRRALNYASFGVSATVLGGSALRRADALWVYNSPITIAAPMLVHSRFGRVPTFLHVQDLWPDSLVESGMFPDSGLGKIVGRSISALVRLLERRSAVVGVISPSVRELILQRHPDLDPSKIVYAPNPTNEDLFRPVDQVRKENGLMRDAEHVDIMYAGAIGDVQGMGTVLDAMEILRNRPEVRLTLVGDGIGREHLESEVSRRHLSNVSLVGRVRQSEIPSIMAQADIQLVSLAANAFLEFTTPSKIPSLLASAVPIVAQISGDGARLLQQSGAALVSAPGDAEGLADAIGTMADCGPEGWSAMGRAGRDYYEANFSAAYTAEIITSALGDLSGSNDGEK